MKNQSEKVGSRKKKNSQFNWIGDEQLTKSLRKRNWGIKFFTRLTGFKLKFWLKTFYNKFLGFFFVLKI